MSYEIEVTNTVHINPSYFVKRNSPADFDGKVFGSIVGQYDARDLLNVRLYQKKSIRVYIIILSIDFGCPACQRVQFIFNTTNKINHSRNVYNKFQFARKKKHTENER